MRCFGNPIVVSGIVELFSLIRGRRHGWPNHVKTSCTVCVIVLSLCSWTNIIGIKAFAGTTIGIRAWVEDFWKSKRSQSTQDENKWNFHWRWSRLLFHGDMIQKGLSTQALIPIVATAMPIMLVQETVIFTINTTRKLTFSDKIFCH